MDTPPETGLTEVAEVTSTATGGGLLPMLSDFARWQKILLSIAACLMVGGLSLSAFGGETPPAAIEQGTPTTANPGGALPSTLLPDGPKSPGPGQAEAETGAPPWSEAIFKYGFSFFVGFAIGFALRAFLKITLVFAGMLALAVFGLEYAGFVSVEWAALDEAFNGFISRVGKQSAEFRTFITGSLPNAGLSTLGLVAGFRKNR